MSTSTEQGWDARCSEIPQRMAGHFHDHEIAASIEAETAKRFMPRAAAEYRQDMRRRGLASPDDADELALTFAYPVAQRCEAEERRFVERLQALKRRIV